MSSPPSSDSLLTLSRAEQELSWLYAMTLAIGAADDVDSAVGMALREICEVGRFAYGQMWTVRLDGTGLECGPFDFYVRTASAGTDELRARSRAAVLPSGVGLPGRAWSMGSPLWIADASTSTESVADLSAAHLASGLGVPIFAGDSVAAVLELYTEHRTLEDEHRVELVSMVAAQLGSLFLGRRIGDAIRETTNLATTLNSIGDGVIATGIDGRITRMNPVAEGLTGWPFAEARGALLGTVLALFDEATQSPLPSVVDATVLPATRIGLTARDGTRRPIVQTTSPIRDALGHTTGHVVVVRDMTQVRGMESRLLFTERMASVGTLAAGVAHEVNNPLAYVVSNLDYVIERLSDIDSLPSSAVADIAEAALEARQGAERVRRIVRDLKAFSRADDEKREVFDVRPLLESSLNMGRNEIRHRARLVKELGDVPRVEANESRLAQVFLNLIINAAQAIPVGDAERNEIRIVTRTDAAGRAVIEVHDTGSGISASALPHIFDPFFTTKAIGTGTGLGLSICQGIVAAAGGEIAVETTVGRGSMFRVTLPAATGETVVTPERSAPALPRARLLVIDDEPLITKGLRRMLRDHDVVAAASGREALGRILAGEHFDVILCDLMMPEMTGIELHEEVARHAPAMLERMVFVTGGAFTESARTFLARPGIEHLEKPVDFKLLRSLIRTRLS